MPCILVFDLAALNEALAAEVQRLKLTAAEISGEGHLSNRMAQQLSINNQMYQVQNQQPNQVNAYQMQRQQSQQQQQNGEAGSAKHDPK